MKLFIDKVDVDRARAVVDSVYRGKKTLNSYYELQRLCDSMESVAPATFTIGKDR